MFSYNTYVTYVCVLLKMCSRFGGDQVLSIHVHCMHSIWQTEHNRWVKQTRTINVSNICIWYFYYTLQNLCVLLQTVSFSCGIKLKQSWTLYPLYWTTEHNRWVKSLNK